ncbi:PREDICTED: transmembrane protein 180-like [Acropora digitifera]|uniref:transmembrane protein 180-like n=1 Tax=Acropora digitifera TaxID=70779 RepID=UPI000779F96B|nr:PREDICTED: transmembrane protein 180-like [Acropora digitifera]
MQSLKINKNALAYSATTLAATMMNSVFNFYYVKTFLNVYKISNYWFNVAQIVFLIWNAINDPLFGYFQDSSTWMVLRKRRLAIFYGAPLFAISFLSPWFPWTWFGFSGDWVVGLHLMTSLCLYDGLFTFVLLAQCSLFAEISTQQEERQTILKYAQVASILGSTALFLTSSVYKNEDRNFHSFQAVCVVIAILSWLLMRYTGMNIEVAMEASSTTSSSVHDGKSLKDEVPLFTLIKQILTQRSFVCFVAMNFFQVFHTTFCSNFFLIFVEHLIGSDAIPAILYSLLTGSVFILPRILVLATSPLLAKFGSYKVILWSFYVKVSLPALVFLAGLNNIWILYIFLIVDNCLPDATFSLFNLSVSDIIDDDMEKYHRNAPISSMIFGTNALFTKPAQSLAPMMVVHILSRYGYKDSQQTGKGEIVSVIASQQLKDAMFCLLCMVPLVVAVFQIIFWKFYPLKMPKRDQDPSKILE